MQLSVSFWTRCLSVDADTVVSMEASARRGTSKDLKIPIWSFWKESVEDRNPVERKAIWYYYTFLVNAVIHGKQPKTEIYAKRFIQRPTYSSR